jgi:hypothetical protein
MNRTTAYPDAEALRDIGIERAVEHADHAVDGWSDWALEAVRQYASRHPDDPFLTEDVRDWAWKRGLPKAPDDRAWGAVMQRARRAGYIGNVGYRSARSSNLSPKILWTST